MGIVSKPLSKLVLFIEDAGIVWACEPCAAECLARSLLIMVHVVVGDTELAPHRRGHRFERCGSLPLLDRITMAPTIIEEVAEIVGSARVLGIGDNCRPKHRHLFKAAWKDIFGCRFHRYCVEISASHGITANCPDESASVKSYCASFIFKDLFRIIEKASSNAIIGKIKTPFSISRRT